MTSQDVARHAGVSRTTVSLVLNNVQDIQISEETRQRVVKTARELNYYPDVSARRLVQGRTQVIGFVERQSPLQKFADPFMGEVLRGLHKAARQHNYDVLYAPFSPAQEPKDSFMRLIQERHADGIVLSGPRFDDDEIIRLHEQGVPIVLQGQLPGANIPVVDVDNVGGARLATEHLIFLGHQRIGMITNGPMIYTAAYDRRVGYKLALQEAGLAVDDDLIRQAAFSPESGYQAMQDLLNKSEPPTAIFIASDAVAIGAIEAARQAGVNIPHELAIVGFDDIPWSAYLNPPLTTVCLPAHPLGWSAGYLLIRLLNREEDEEIEDRVLLDTKLVVRESCGAGLRP